jgi:hypothetical protein
LYEGSKKDLTVLTSAAAVPVTSKPRGRPPKNKTKQNQQDRDDRRDASVEPVTLTDSPLPECPVGPTFLALLSPASVASVTSSLRSSNKNKKKES